MISGLSHITFITSDLQRMTQLMESVFGARQIYSSGEKTFSRSREKFFLIGDLWFAVMEGAAARTRTYDHIAFKVREADLAKIQMKIEAFGLTPEKDRPRVEGEGKSLYFYDWDDHLFELHTGSLQERLVRYAL